MIRSAWRSYEYQNQPRCYVGFRCVRSMVNDGSRVKNAAKSAGSRPAASAQRTRR